MRPFILCLFLIPSLLFADGELFTRRYLLDNLPDFGVLHADTAMRAGRFGGGEPFGPSAAGRDLPAPLPWARISQGAEDLQAHLTETLGMEFPEGSWVRFQMVPMSLTLHNTQAGHDLLMLGLIKIRAFARQIQIDLRMISFPSAELDALERAAGRPLTDAAILRLWREGQGETIFAQGIKTINGVNAIIESVVEHIYPTEMWSKEVQMVTEDGEAVVHPPYGGFETRMVGFILNVTPVVNSTGNSISLVLLPERTEDFGHDPHAPDKLRPVLPRFGGMNITTSMVLHNGETVLIGNSSSTDRRERLFLFVTATLIDAGGHPIAGPARADD